MPQPPRWPGNISAREQAEPTFSLRELLEAVAPPQSSAPVEPQAGPADWWELMEAQKGQRSRHLASEDRRRRGVDMMALMREKGPQKGYPEGVDVHPDFRDLYTPEVVRSFQDVHGRWLDPSLAEQVPLNLDLPYEVDPEVLRESKEFVDPEGPWATAPVQPGLGKESLAYARMRQPYAGWADDPSATYAGEHMTPHRKDWATEYRPDVELESATERARAIGDMAAVTPEERELIDRWNKFRSKQTIGQSKTRPMTPEEWGLTQTSVGELGSLTPKEQTELAGVKEAWGASSRLSEEEANRVYAEWQKQEAIKRQDSIKELMESRQQEAMVRAAGGVPELPEDSWAQGPANEAMADSSAARAARAEQTAKDNHALTGQFEDAPPVFGGLPGARERLSEVWPSSLMEHPQAKEAARAFARTGAGQTEEERGLFGFNALMDASAGQLNQDDLMFAELMDAGFLDYGSLSGPVADYYVAVVQDIAAARNNIISNLLPHPL